MTDSAVQPVRWHDVDGMAALEERALQRILLAAEQAVATRGRFVLVLAGGGTPRGIYQRLTQCRVDWSDWHVYFGDERCLPADDPERNSVMAATAWLDHVDIPRDQIHVIAAEQGPSLAARDYARRLEGVSDFDLVLLGLGEDGHTASLFPGQPLNADDSVDSVADALAVYDAPKPPPQRVSLSASRLSRAREVLFLVNAAGKEGAIKQWRNGDAIPAAAIQPPGGVDILIVTDEARRPKYL